MKEYNKSSKLEHVAYDIRGPVLEEAMRMRANGEKILRLNTGNPARILALQRQTRSFMT